MREIQIAIILLGCGIKLLEVIADDQQGNEETG